MTASKSTKKPEKEVQSMKLVDVIPIARGIAKEKLTYFTSKDVQAGALVSVPLRNKYINAIAVSATDALMSKDKIKSSPYALKKIRSVKSQVFFLPEFILSAQDSARYFVGTTGSVLNAMTPAAISSSPEDVFKKTDKKINARKKINLPTQKIREQSYLLQTEEQERISTYKSIVREEFAKGSSVFFCLPEISEIERIAETLERGIEKYTYILHSGIPKKQLLRSWQSALDSAHPVLIIATGKFLSLPRSDISTIIVEKESSRSYKQATRPFVDVRAFAEIFARHMGARIIFGDIFLRPETINKYKEGISIELSPLKFRALSTAKPHVIDMKKYTDPMGNKKFKLFSDELVELITRQRKENENTFILTARRGLYPITICNDCGNTTLCSRCSSPTVLHKGASGKSNISACHKCGLKQDASDRCNSCGGWRLATLGTGTENIAEELKRIFQNIQLFHIDKDNTKNHKKATEVRDRFYETPGSILLGTEMVASYLNQPIDNIAVVSVDSLFTIPDFRINERVFNLLLRLRARASKHFLIQTRDIDNRIFDYVVKGNMIDFYREEMAERKILNYPPFTTLLKITREGIRSAVVRDMEKLSRNLHKYSPIAYPAFIHTVKGKYRMNILLKIPSKEWVDDNLLKILHSLPQYFTVRVDPEDVL